MMFCSHWWRRTATGGVTRHSRKFCVNCLFFAVPGFCRYDPFCPGEARTGQPSVISCYTCRNSSGLCGQQGKWFQPTSKPHFAASKGWYWHCPECRGSNLHCHHCLGIGLVNNKPDAPAFRRLIRLWKCRLKGKHEWAYRDTPIYAFKVLRQCLLCNRWEVASVANSSFFKISRRRAKWFLNLKISSVQFGCYGRTFKE